MPELPEVETTRRGLALKMEGRRIARIEARRPDLRWPLPRDFAARIQGKRVLGLERRAKYILVRLEAGPKGDLVWLIHLGMSGRMLVRPGGWPNAIDKHDHVIFTTDEGWSVTFNDARRFGAMDLIEPHELPGHKLLAELGPEPLDDAFTPAALAAALKGRRTPMKAALLDQHVVAGLGNIYVSEALFRAGIHPERLAGSVSPKRLERLVPEIKQVLQEAIAAGGSSLRDYVQTSGELGYFKHAFRVYDREGQPCPACKRAVRRIVQSGRSTFFCAACQR
ncbi:bifunctional DNA-formamidopyrimidine glycosylase/DNA-(apurinic or apyrimidinic site) lyase [Ferrovibrio sp.]|uniref:bifunctional DNA-formamidopyrimidine glycosylase/DNA-(apurinic or apyrimidinic site) lyase n=1 Tax=Ferrovibrio sp. TaxID=1917215 RepID=UPI0025BFA763|nr:bifunctional DNA-formamidopyrimidine glycosylase/DNA-(apurinic or apyrimidinic site) lyase [Ferrovibrio sp.]MBX3455642.1 bifunctional DNA-formamidopyrimidine glycosylase/DNA-(apurinic or apyrimidinic site) lyase [Ferrovibrio sp.]